MSPPPPISLWAPRSPWGRFGRSLGCRTGPGDKGRRSEEAPAGLEDRLPGVDGVGMVARSPGGQFENLQEIEGQRRQESKAPGGRWVGPVGTAWLTVSSLPVSPAGSTPFPYNPLIMRLQAGVMASPPPPGLPAGSGPLAGPHHAWDEEPKPLLCSQYETLSDSE